MSLGRQLKFWGLALLGVLIFLYVFAGILLPFVVGMALAYLLDPVADRLQALGLSRSIATFIIVLSLILIFVLVGVVLIPVIANQVSGFVENIPRYVERLRALVTSVADGRFDAQYKMIEAQLGSIVSQGAGWATGLLGSLWNGGQAVVSIISLMIIAPVVAFYLLFDWDRMVEEIDSWLPLRHRDTVRRLASEMDGVVAGFVRGQTSVCLAMAVFYAIGLTAVGLNFGLVIGLVAGILGFIPFVGVIVGLISSVGVAFIQFWPEWQWVLVVLGIFVAGQMIEGYILQPAWVGRSVGLHPVWLMFSLLAFGSLFGFVGALIAVPAAASIGVLARFALHRYLESPFYTAPSDTPQ